MGMIENVAKVCTMCLIEKDKSEFPKWKSTCVKCTSIKRMSLPSYRTNAEQQNKKKSEELQKKYRAEVETQRQEIFSKDTNDEIWQFIPNYDGKYQASNLGRVRCLPTVYRKGEGNLVKTDYYIVSPQKSRGYLKMTLTDSNGLSTSRGLHRWIMYAFHGESELQVDHINGIKDDNRLENLRYCTARENVHYEKLLNGEKYTSPLLGTYWHKNGWYSYINIEGVEHYLGCYNTDVEAANKFETALKEWNEFGKLPEKYINPNKTSTHRGIDFHGTSGKWRVRTEDHIYIGIFETEVIALKVKLLVEYIKLRYGIDSEVIKKIRKKYAKDNRLNHD